MAAEERRESRRRASLKYARTSRSKKNARERYEAVKDSSAFRRTVRNQVLKRKYGMTIEDYEARLAKQGAICALCRAPFGAAVTTRPVVDHDHKTGTVRGILHQRCNTILGFLRDSPVWADQCREYLEHHA